MALTIQSFSRREERPHIPPSRTIDLTSPSELKRYIRAKRAAIKRNEELHKYREREGR